MTPVRRDAGRRLDWSQQHLAGHWCRGPDNAHLASAGVVSEHFFFCSGEVQGERASAQRLGSSDGLINPAGLISSAGLKVCYSNIVEVLVLRTD